MKEGSLFLRGGGSTTGDMTIDPGAELLLAGNGDNAFQVGASTDISGTGRLTFDDGASNVNDRDLRRHHLDGERHHEASWPAARRSTTRATSSAPC